MSTNPSRSIFQRIDHAILTFVGWVLTLLIASAFGFIIVGLFLIFLVGCAKHDIVVADKDAPLFVSDTGIFDIRVSAWDEEQDSLVDLGWFSKDILVGRTIAVFDWDSYARGVSISVSQYEVDGQIDLDLLRKTFADIPEDKIVTIDYPTNYDRVKFLAVCRRLRPDLEINFQ